MLPKPSESILYPMMITTNNHHIFRNHTLRPGVIRLNYISCQSGRIAQPERSKTSFFAGVNGPTGQPSLLLRKLSLIPSLRQYVGARWIICLDLLAGCMLLSGMQFNTATRLHFLIDNSTNLVSGGRDDEQDLLRPLFMVPSYKYVNGSFSNCIYKATDLVPSSASLSLLIVRYTATGSHFGLCFPISFVTLPS